MGIATLPIARWCIQILWAWTQIAVRDGGSVKDAMAQGAPEVEGMMHRFPLATILTKLNALVVVVAVR